MWGLFRGARSLALLRQGRPADLDGLQSWQSPRRAALPRGPANPRWAHSSTPSRSWPTGRAIVC